MNYKSNKKRSKTPPSIDSLFTGVKTPEYAVFYNIAYWWVSDFLKSLYDPHKKNPESDKSTDDNSKYIKRFQQEETSPSLSNSAYLKLRDYFWKGYLFAKNSSDMDVTEKDKRLIHKMVSKLSEIRNFHSHYWHDNSNLACDKELKDWIDYLHNYALSQLQKENQKDVDKYKEKRNSDSLFDKHDDQYYISQDGRNFFLSFFLKKGEISRFMQQRKGCKRNDKPEFKLKHLLYRYYTHRDGATKNRYSIETSAFNELGEGMQTEILHARQLYKMISYLRDVPTELIDQKLFPLYVNEEEVKTAEQMVEFITKYNLLPKCAFGTLENKEGITIQKTIAFNYEQSNYGFEIKVNALHKLLLDVIRDPNRENDFYNSLNTFGQFRDEFPEKLKAFIHGNESLEDIMEYYTFKLKANDYTRGRLWNIIESVSTNKKVNYSAKEELFQLLYTKPIELIYHNFYFEKDQKPRRENQFLFFAANFLMDKNITPDWEWLMEKFEPEEVTCKIEGAKQIENTTKQVVKRIKVYSEKIPVGYRLSCKNEQLLVRLKSKPEQTFGIGQSCMRNALVAHFQRKPINHILFRLCEDIHKIKQAGIAKEPLSYDSLTLLNDKTMPRYLKIMMRDKEIIKNETIGYASLKAKERIERLTSYFEDILNGKEQLNRKEINTQLIRCYKFFDWKYDNNKEYKFLRQNEYQLMSIYHYTLAKNNSEKNNLSASYLQKLRKDLFVDIQQHLPQKLNEILEKKSSLDNLFEAILTESIKLLKSWSNRLGGMNPERKKACLSKLGIKVPAIPVPDQSIQQNLKQMQHLPLLIHPALVFKAFNYTKGSTLFADFRNADNNMKGLLVESYRYEAYQNMFCNEKGMTKNTIHKIIGSVNKLKTVDTLVWKMAQVYLSNNGSAIMQNISKLLLNESDKSFRLNHLHDTQIPVFKSDANIEKPYCIRVKFKQLGDYMLITGNPLEKLAMQIFKRYGSDECLRKAGIEKNNTYYTIDYSLIKQEMDRVYQESIMMTDFILQWEKRIVDAIPASDKSNLRSSAIKEGGKAYLSFRAVCNYAKLSKSDEDELCVLRNHAMHAKIPMGFTYKEKFTDDRIKKMIGITDDMLNKYEKKNDFYEAQASMVNG